jgi:carboxypeptidase Taq
MEMNKSSKRVITGQFIQKVGCKSKEAREYQFMGTYEKLLERTKEILQFQTGLAVIRWDLQTFMPPKGMKQRSEQLALMSKILHRMATSESVQQLVSKLEKIRDNLNPTQQREVELVSRMLKRRAGIPEDLVSRESAQKTLATAAWKRAKETNNWKLFESELSILLEISRKIADIMMERMELDCQLDAFMDMWEPKMTTKLISGVFSDLRKMLVPLTKKFQSACSDIKVDFKKRAVPIHIQRELVTDLANVMGYDTTSKDAGGRIDESEHPFTTGYYDDVRFTIHYQEDDLFRAVFGGLHETGHALHNQNQNSAWKWMMLGKSCSSGFSESQSRFVENIIGRSPEFWKYYYPHFLELTKGIFNDISYQEILQAINIVDASKIRVLADEMTYALHIIIRFEIEEDLFSEKISVSEIPSIWNEKYDEYLGVKIETDTEGALQDVHWSWAYWGYFPTYALGNLYAAMLDEKMTSDIPDWKIQVSGGEISNVVHWLADNVHKKSNLYDPPEMIGKITGKSLTAEPFIKYLSEKYSQIF